MSDTPVEDPTVKTTADPGTDYATGHDASGAPVLPTAVDAAGNERIVGRTSDNWRPAPVEPDPRHVEALARANAQEAEDKTVRTEALTDSSRLGETAQPLVEANKARDAEHEQFVADQEARDAAAAETPAATETPAPVETPAPDAPPAGA